MIEEFERLGVNKVSSVNGFVVEARFAEIAYSDSAGAVNIYAEWLGTPTGVVLYKQSLNQMSTSRVDAVLSNITKAMNYFGHRVEINSDQLNRPDFPGDPIT